MKGEVLCGVCFLFPLIGQESQAQEEERGEALGREERKGIYFKPQLVYVYTTQACPPASVIIDLLLVY